MKEYSSSTTIHASPQVIWDILVDAPNYPQWDPGVERIEGRIAPGEEITAFSKLSPGRGFPAKVSEFDPGRRMVWSSGMPLGLFKGVRTFTLAPQGNGTVHFKLHEAFSGPLLPLIGRSIPDMSENFRQFVDGLKKQPESVAG